MQFRWERSLWGTHLEGIGECIGALTNHRIAYQLIGGTCCVITFLIEPADDGCRVTVFLRYTEPSSWHENDGSDDLPEAYAFETTTLLRNLKTAVEAQTQTLEIEGYPV
jgi:hypothetical protein